MLHFKLIISFTGQLPAVSTDVERAFSQGGLTVSKMQHSLTDKSLRAATVLGTWCDIPGVINQEGLAVKFNDKSKQTKECLQTL